MLEELETIQDFLAVNSDEKRAKKDFHVVLICFYSFNSFGSHTISSVLKSHGFKVSHIFFKNYFVDNMDLPTEAEYKHAVKLINKLKPDLIGIGSMSTFAPITVELIERLKGIGKPVVFGGSHAIYNPDHAIKYADIVCVGEGEAPILKLAYKLYNGQEYDNIRNLWIKKNGSVIKNELYPLLQNLDLIPFPDFSNENKYFIENNNLRIGEPYYTNTLSWYNFMSGRGCPFICTYCCNSYLIKYYKNKGSMLRRRTVDNVINELKIAKSMFPKLSVISSNDEVFVLDREWLVDFCEKYKNEIDVPFHCDIHPSKVSDETINILKKIRLKTVTMGVQAGSEKVRKEIYKRHTSDNMIIKAGKVFKKYNVFPSYDFIFDNPLETIETLEDSLTLLLRLPRPFRTNTYSMQYHPKTELTSYLLEKGIIKDDEIDGCSLKGLKQWHVRLQTQYKCGESYYIYALFKIFSYSFVVVTPRINLRVSVFPTFIIKIIIKNKTILKRKIFFLKVLCDIGENIEKLGRLFSVLLSLNFSKIFEKLFHLQNRGKNAFSND